MSIWFDLYFGFFYGLIMQGRVIDFLTKPGRLILVQLKSLALRNGK